MNEEFVHNQKNLGHSPRKLRLVADMIRRMTPEQALLSLRFTNKAAALDLAKAIKTALANAGGSGAKLVFKKIEVNEGLALRRWKPKSRSQGRPYARRLSHVKIVLVPSLPANLESTKPEEKLAIQPPSEPVKKGEKKTKKV